jgi:hypothetical protein
VLRGFEELMPKIAEAFPDRKVVLRPHPSEDHEFWRRCLAAWPNVVVKAEGNVVPWLIACGVLVHNGCTTAVEGFELGTRIVSFVPKEDERYEFALPNQLGVRCSDATAVIDAIANPVADRDPSGARRKLVDRFIHEADDELAAERVLFLVPGRLPLARWRRLPIRVAGMVHAEVRMLVKRFQRKAGVARYSESFMRQRFPELDVPTMQKKADRMLRITNSERGVRVTQRERDLFEISPC